MYETPVTGLVLTGGGARAAYQVGVLRALARLRQESATDLRRNPFAVICGTSAGAINSAALACQADRFDDSVERLFEVWRSFRAEQVYRADSLGVIRSGAQWLTMLSIGWVLSRWRRARPRSLLDNSPLGDLLERAVALGTACPGCWPRASCRRWRSPPRTTAAASMSPSMNRRPTSSPGRARSAWPVACG